jgi:predicted DNA-binding transcriptional regulator AlpA
MKDLEALPDSAQLTVKDVAAYISVSAATVWRWVKEGKLPEPVRHSKRCTRWRCGDVRRAIGIPASDQVKVNCPLPVNPDETSRSHT